MKEIWKDIPGWEGLYQASNNGRIRSKKRKSSVIKRIYGGKIIKPVKARNGYMIVNLTGKGTRYQMLVHRAVLTAFYGIPEEGLEACHNNGDRTENKLENLRWDTRKNNHADKKKHGTHQVGEKVGNSKLTDTDIKLIRSSELSAIKLGKILNVNQSCVLKARNRQTWKHLP